ncbi:MAG: AraC family transcriptional regulator [Lachnospiraceae bacterium]|nr:AraC family transcriptional regulator [Lachnospiraceae bacterium]
MICSHKDYRLIRPDSQNITELKRICARMSEAKHSKELGSSALICAYMTEFLVKVSRAYYDTPDTIKNDVTENEKVNQILLYINENLSEDLSLDRLASRFYISKYYLSRQFKQFTGLSLYQYIAFKREFGKNPSEYSKT